MAKNGQAEAQAHAESVVAAWSDGAPDDRRGAQRRAICLRDWIKRDREHAAKLLERCDSFESEADAIEDALLLTA